MTPETEAELADFVAAASAPLRIAGGGSKNMLGQPVDGLPLSTTGLSGITLYEPGALTLVARAGTTLGEITTALEAEGQMLPFEPMDYRTLLGSSGEPTLGGTVACNISGPRRIQAGACRDSLIGVRLVDGLGQIVKNGGRVMKNVTGYDLVKLMAGSFGTLGVLTEVSFKVLPKAETSITLMAEGLSNRAAITALSKALGSPWEVSGAAHLGAQDASEAQTLIRLEGFDAQVTYRAGRLQDALKGLGDFEISDRSDLWQRVRDVAPLRDHSTVWRVSVKPGVAPDVVEALKRHAAFDYFYDWGGGLIWIGIGSEQNGGDAPKLVSDTTNTLREKIAGLGGGHVTLVKASAEARGVVSMFHPEAPEIAALSRGIRQKFDPKGILNPGLMG
jgi:glycolate oxidase FAD binding subunit